MPNPLVLLCPLIAAILYAVAASALKGATERGVGGVQATVVANLATAAAFLVFVPWGGDRWLPPVWWPTLALAGAFCVGQFLTVFALKWGHASLATPALGSKVVLVALLAALAFDLPVGANVWVGAVLTTAGMVTLAWPSEHVPLRTAAAGVALATLAAACFAVFDTLTQVASRLPGLSFGLVLPPAMALNAAASTTALLLLHRRWPPIPSPARRHLALGAGVLTAQAIILISAIGHFGNAPAMNVVYGSRGVWSVLLVWTLGRHFSRHESHHHLPRSVFARRLAGALLIAAAVALVFVVR